MLHALLSRGWRTRRQQRTIEVHDLSPDGGTYPTILFCRLLAVTRETKVTLSNHTKP